MAASRCLDSLLAGEVWLLAWEQDLEMKHSLSLVTRICTWCPVYALGVVQACSPRIHGVRITTTKSTHYHPLYAFMNACVVCLFVCFCLFVCIKIGADQGGSSGTDHVYVTRDMVTLYVRGSHGCKSPKVKR